MKPSKLATDIAPAQLAKARGKRQEHSTRDKPKFIKQLKDIESAFRKLGYEIFVKKSS